ncbi:MAG: 50S ribosomal protein L4 [Candidatus Peribacteraceae bacterium]
MTIDLYTSTGTKKGTVELPTKLFGARINKGLMHLALVMQQGNRRLAVAHAKSRGEVVGSTKKLFQQKGTGNARRGPKRSPILRGGGKAFGPKKEANFTRSMPKNMRRAALFSALSLRAKNGEIVALESYPEDVKTKTFVALLKKLPVPIGRKIIFVLGGKHKGLELSARNVPGIKTLTANYLNPEDVLSSHALVFMTDAIRVAEETFSRKEKKEQEEINETKEKKPKVVKKTSSKSSRSSTSSAS